MTGVEDEAGYAGGWRTTAVDVFTTPVAGLKMATGTTAVDSTAFKQSIAVCPAGTRIHAGGFDLGTAVGQANLTAAFLDVDVNSDPTRQGYEAQAREDGTGYAGIWRLGTWAICAN